MKSFLIAILACLFLAPLSSSRAEEPPVGALAAADDARVAAFVAADRAKLEAVLSDELRYAHSSGAVDTKASLIEALTTHRLTYLGLTYSERNFTFPAPTIALMSGRVHLQVKTATGAMEAEMSYLGVWRLEHDGWHFLAWQSAKLAPPAAK